MKEIITEDECLHEFLNIINMSFREFQTIIKKTKSFYDIDLRINLSKIFFFDFDLRNYHQENIHLIHPQYMCSVQITTILLDFDTSYFQAFDESIDKKRLDVIVEKN